MYMLFSGSYYYPQGGWDDYIGTFPTEEMADEYLAQRRRQMTGYYEWAHLVDAARGAIVKTYPSEEEEEEEEDETPTP